MQEPKSNPNLLYNYVTSWVWNIYYYYKKTNAIKCARRNSIHLIPLKIHIEETFKSAVLQALRNPRSRSVPSLPISASLFLLYTLSQTLHISASCWLIWLKPRGSEPWKIQTYWQLTPPRQLVKSVNFGFDRPYLNFLLTYNQGMISIS